MVPIKLECKEVARDITWQTHARVVDPNLMSLRGQRQVLKPMRGAARGKVEWVRRTVSAVQPRRRSSTEEELRAIGVGAGVGHAQHAGAIVLERKVLIVEHCTVHALATSAVAGCKVTCGRRARIRAGAVLRWCLLLFGGHGPKGLGAITRALQGTCLVLSNAMTRCCMQIRVATNDDDEGRCSCQRQEKNARASTVATTRRVPRSVLVLHSSTGMVIEDMGSRKCGLCTSLAHELGDDSMEDGALEVQRLP
jgi:hypothetical protein